MSSPYIPSSHLPHYAISVNIEQSWQHNTPMQDPCVNAKALSPLLVLASAVLSSANTFSAFSNFPPIHLV